MIQKPVEQISKEDIQSLVTAKVSERRTLDYKQQLPGRSDEEKREFLYDVSSFTNALGGDLVFGVEDERDESGKATGLPSSANGVVLSNISAEIARLENLIRDGIELRIQAIQWKIVEGFPSGPVIVMRIPKSLMGPHMVVFGGMARFYSRNSTGKYPMDIQEIRSAFVESMATGERLRAFRDERLAKITRGDTPIGYNTETAKLVIHLIPLSSLGPTVSRDVTKDAARLQARLSPMEGTSWGGRYNFDGYLVLSSKSESYVQVFRSGVIEAAVHPFLGLPEQYRYQISGIGLEQTILNAVGNHLEAQRRLGIPLPIFVAVSLLGVRHCKMPVRNVLLLSDGQPIDRDNLLLPEILFEEYGNVDKALRPAFDALWQSCGYEESPNYDADGNWRAFS